MKSLLSIPRILRNILPSRRSRISFDDYRYNPANGELIINIKAQKLAKQVFSSNVIRLKYITIKPAVITEAEAADIFCAYTIPHLSAQNAAIDVYGAITQEQSDFWTTYCDKLFIGSLSKPNIRWLSRNQRESTAPTISDSTSKIALLFGGGVESLTALSDFLIQKPLLLSLVGPLWMNNDYEKSNLKYNLENRLCIDFDIEIARVWHNIKEVVKMPDEYTNKYITGGLMYYPFMPIIRERNCSKIYHSMEREYMDVDEQYDRSINPRFSHHVGRPPLPPLEAVMTEYSKIELLERLYQNNPKLFSYLYSCLNNTSLRWCGKCGKCQRLSAFCETIGIDKSLIGMQEGISHERETGTLTKLYWQNLDIHNRRETG